MCNSKKIINVASVLETRASGCSEDILNDLNKPEGKSIAELLHDQETTEIPPNTPEQCE